MIEAEREGTAKNKDQFSDSRRSRPSYERREVKHRAKILLADDFELWRRFVVSLLKKRPEWQVIGEVSDGWQVVQRTKELRPDLVLLDIGLPTLNGIEAARLIRTCAPETRILFVSAYDTFDLAVAALRAGGQGYVIKSRGPSDLLVAIEAVLQYRLFASNTLKGDDFARVSGNQFRDSAGYTGAPA